MALPTDPVVPSSTPLTLDRQNTPVSVDPVVAEQVDAILPPDTTPAVREEAQQLAQQEVDRLGGVGDTGVNAWAIPGAVADVLQADGIETIASPQVIEAVDAGLARDATTAQRQAAYQAVQAEIDNRGSPDADVPPGLVNKVLATERLPIDGNFAAQQGRNDAAELQALLEQADSGDLDEAGLARLEELRQTLTANENNPAYAAAYFQQLGPQGAAQLPMLFDLVAQNYDSGPVNGDTYAVDYEAFGRSLSTALGTASRSGELPADFAAQLRDHSEPTTEAIYLSTGTFEPSFVADLSQDVLLYHDPNTASYGQAFEVEGRPISDWGQQYWGTSDIYQTQSSFDIALAAIDRSGAQNVVLARDGVAERLLDPWFPDGGFAFDNTEQAVAALLATPGQSLAADPNNANAVAAAVSLVEATVVHKGDISDVSTDAILQLYVDHPGEILNSGEDVAAWNTDTAFGRALAASTVAGSGSSHFVVAAAMGRESASDFEQRREAVVQATADYRNEVALAGPGDNPDAWGREIGEIDTDLMQGTGRRAILDGHEQDERNGRIRWVIDKLTDYSGKIPYGQPVTGWAAKGVNLVEDYGLDAILPIDNATGARDEIPGDIQSQIIATQYTVLDGAVRSGAATDVPPELLADPNDPGQGLRMPDPENPDDVAAFNRQVQDYVSGLPANDPTRLAIAEATKVLETAYSDFDLAILPE